MVETIRVPGVTDFSYIWDANKRKLAENDAIIPPLNNQSFGYDNEDRLTSFNRNNGDSQSWNLSLVGNWNAFSKNGAAETRAHSASHEIQTITNGVASTLFHDPKGNLTVNKNGQGYEWDIENRLKAATVPAGAVEGIVGTHSYAYDALGRRVSKTVAGVTTVYVNDGLQEIAEYENGVLARQYVFGTYIDEPLVMIAGSINHYYHANQIYSVSALTNAAGSVIERYTYDPYGKVTVREADGDPVAATTIGNPWTFTGRRLDGETKSMYYRARIYDTELGRFPGRDPYGLIENRTMAGPNYSHLLLVDTRRREFVQTTPNETYVYLYVRSNPLSWLDPSGLKPCDAFVLTTVPACNAFQGDEYKSTGFCQAPKPSLAYRSHSTEPVGLSGAGSGTATVYLTCVCIRPAVEMFIKPPEDSDYPFPHCGACLRGVIDVVSVNLPNPVLESSNMAALCGAACSTSPL